MITNGLAILIGAVILAVYLIYTDTITWYNFIPFKTIVSAFQNGVTTTAITQIIGNIALAVPFGIMVLMLFKLPHWWQKLLIALSFTIAIESSQLYIGLFIGNICYS